jgi:predicted DNA-binding transcriptional regulator AlpA
MPSAPIRTATVPSSQFTPRKLSESQKPAKNIQNGTSNNSDDLSFLRLLEVKAVTGLSKTSLYALIRDKNFPAPVRLGPRSVAWVRSGMGCPANSVPVVVREIGMEGARDGQGEEA